MDLNIDTYNWNGKDITILEIKANNIDEIKDGQNHIAAAYLAHLATDKGDIYIRVLMNETDITYNYHEFVETFKLTKHNFTAALEKLKEMKKD